jgi:hypothetical protein
MHRRALRYHHLWVKCHKQSLGHKIVVRDTQWRPISWDCMLINTSPFNPLVNSFSMICSRDTCAAGHLLPCSYTGLLLLVSSEGRCIVLYWGLCTFTYTSIFLSLNHNVSWSLYMMLQLYNADSEYLVHTRSVSWIFPWWHRKSQIKSAILWANHSHFSDINSTLSRQHLPSKLHEISQSDQIWYWFIVRLSLMSSQLALTPRIYFMI